MEKLRAYVQKVIDEQGLTSWQIQKRSNGRIKDSYVNDILSGKTKSIGVDKLNALAQGLGVDSIELFKIASGEEIAYKQDDPWPSMVLSKAIDQIVSSPELTQIVKALLKAKPSKVKAVKKILELG